MEMHAPWLADYGKASFHLEYPDGGMYDAVLKTASDVGDFTALSYMKRRISYSLLIKKIDELAASFTAAGVECGDVVTLCLPNIPQTVYCLYALNRIGAVACMMHPLSAVEEISPMMEEAGSDFAVVLDSFSWKFASVKVKTLLVCSAANELGYIKKAAFWFGAGRKYAARIPNGALLWSDFIKSGRGVVCKEHYVDKNDCAVILFSGGTTGITKAIRLSNLNLNAMALQTESMCVNPIKGKRMLAAMPMFHGFGLGVCVHAMLVVGATSILVPHFNVKQYAHLIRDERPNYLVGVPTLFEALTRTDCLDGVKLDCLLGVFSGGDSLSVELKEKMDAFLLEHGASVRVREGYGATECVAASCLTPLHKERKGSIGLPYPDTYYAICAVDGTEELPYGTEGEICLRGPSVMLGYIGHGEENAKVLQTHADGHTWLHTGDLGVMDSDGFIYFRQRIKRMIVSSGYNVYPSQIENVLDSHPSVKMSCVIGIKDDYKMHKAKAFVVVADGVSATDALKSELMLYCKQRISKYALPCEIEFRDKLPQTSLGKVAYRVLEQEEEAKNN